MASFVKTDAIDLSREDVSDSDEEREKNTELFSAISKGNLEKIIQLLESGVQINIVDRNNKDNSPLHYATEKGTKEIVEELLLQKWTTDINAQNNKGDTPLHIAICKGNEELVRLLLSKQPKIDIKNKKDEIPLDIAKRLEPERKDIIQMLETPLDSKLQQVEDEAGQPPPVQPTSITARQPEQSPHRNKNTNVNSQNVRRKQGDPVHGNIYQLKLLMLFLYRGVSHEPFRLGTEIEEAKKFDDLVFEYTEGGKKKYRLLQAKHRLDESKKIMANNLLTESDGDYSLTKYFFSYQDSKKEKLFKDGSIEDVTICTNINLDFEDLKSAQIRIEKIKSKDDILDVKSDKKQPARYRFNEQVTLLLKPILQDYNLTRLARRLTECVLKNNSIKHHEKNDIFKDYHLALAENVIDINNKKFHEKFIKNEEISEDGKKFRKAFGEEIKVKSEGTLTLENINEAIVTKRKVVNNEEPVGLNLSKNFGRGENKNWPNNAISDDEVKDFLNHFVIAVNQPNEEELGEIIKKEIGKEFDLDMTENVYNKFFMAMLNWLQGKEGGRFFTYKEGKEFFEEVRRGIPIWFEAKQPVHWFTGRKQELIDLHEKVKRSSEKITVISQMTSISGLGGIGKTELARQYIHEHSNDYDNNVVWINAESEATLTETFRRLAQDKLRISSTNIDGKEKYIESIVEDVYRFFTKRRSLFIFDNADKSDPLRTFLPFNILSSDDNMPYILVTSRNQGWNEGIEVLNLHELNLVDATEFVKKGLGMSKENVSQDPEIEKLVKMVQCFPLALQQAVAHIREAKKKFNRRGNRKYTIGRYLEEYEENKKKLLNSKAFQSLDNDYVKTTFTTWKVTTNKIKGNTKYGQLALQILDVIAYFAPKSIPVEIFFAKLEKNNEKLWKSVELLNQYSMIRLEHGELDVHRLVTEVTRLNLDDKEKEVLEKALKLFQDGSSQINIFTENLRLSNVDHAISVWNHANKHEELVREFSSLPVFIVSELAATLKFQEAHLFGNNSLNVLERIIGDDHPSVLSLMEKFASILCALSKYNDSLEVYRKLKEKVHIINEHIKPEISLVDSNIGQILHKQGKYDEALNIFFSLYNLVKEGILYSGGEIEQHLALTLYCKKKFDEAFIMYKIALQRNLEVLGPDHENTLATQSGIILILEMQGKYDEALEICKEIYEKRTRLLGLNHPDTLQTYGSIARLLFYLRKYDEALKIANDIEKESEEILPNSQLTLTRKRLMVAVLDSQCKYDEALEMCKELYEKSTKINEEPNHPFNLIDLNMWYKLAVKIANQCKYNKALDELNNVLKERKKMLEPNHPDILQTQDVIGQLEVLNELLSKGLDANIQITDEYCTPLLFAAQNGQAKVVEKLLEKKANVDTKTMKGFTALHLAAEKNHLNVVRALLKWGADANCYDNAHIRPLHIAAQKGFLDIVNELLSKDADANVQSANSLTTPLHHSAQYGHARVVEKLLEKEANINARNIDGITALHLAAHRNYLDVVYTLLKGSADVNRYDNELFSPLHFAVQEGHTKIVQLLLKNGADIEATNIYGITPLHTAAYYNQLDAVKVLLEEGANIDACHPFNMIPSDVTNDESIKKVLLSTKQLLNAIRQKQNQSNIQRFLEDGAVINYFSGTTRLTSLHYAVSHGNSDIVRLLLTKKPNVNVANEDGWTPLHYAAQDGHLPIVKLLIDNGADPSIQNRDKKTPLQLARERFDHDPQIYEKIEDILKSESLGQQE